MASERSPLLEADNPGTVEGAGSSSPSKNGSKRSWTREIAIFAWALLATAVVIIFAVWIQHSQQTSSRRGSRGGKRNLIFMVSDGMGPASLSLTRSYRQHVDGLPEADILTLDRHLWGSSRTRSSNSLVTDSAAGATAFSCGKKSYNGAISVLPDGQPCGSVLEAAHRAGYTTGLVVTTDVTDATPACFASHVATRQMQDEIALQEIGEGPLGRTVDLMLGGGRCHFMPNTTSGSCRQDDVDVVALAARKHGWAYAGSRAAFDDLAAGADARLPLLGLFAATDLPFELDRRLVNDTYPSLAEMTRTALAALERATAHTDKGFFLMIEGSRIDHAGHINDPAAQVHEVLEYDAAFAAVLDFIDRTAAATTTDVETVLVATSDHETGGLALALQEPGHLPVYNWYPQVLANATRSSEKLADELRRHLADHAAAGSPDHNHQLKRWINDELIVRGLGVPDATDAELALLAEHPESAVTTLAAIISLRAHIGWSTHGHTAVDVNVYTSGGPGTHRIRGNVENTDIGKFLSQYLGVDDHLDHVTRELRRHHHHHHHQRAATATAAAGDPPRDGESIVSKSWDKYHAFAN